MTELADRILQQISGASSKSPADADAVRVCLSLQPAEFDPALKQLMHDCRINTAHITRRGHAFTGIWPTGVFRPGKGWSGASHSALFLPVAPIVPALRNASAPRVRPDRPATQHPAQSHPQENTPVPPRKTSTAPTAPAVKPRATTPLSFALWDDGRLDIYDGHDLMQLAANDTARLARLLGVPANNTSSQ